MDINSRLQVDATLEVGGQSETVTVTATTVHVETTSTQIGEVVPAATMTTLSLNGRSFTDLLAIQPGVIPVTTMQSDSIIMAGVTGAVAPSGQLNPGNLSISGQRESANSFLVNGSDVQERMNGGTSIVPDLDSVDQFRVLTSNFDPQYGNYNGGIVSVITKSGSDVLSRQRVRLRPQHLARREELFLAGARRVQAAAARRHAGRAGQEREGVLLRRLSGHAHDAGHRDRSHSGADHGRTGRAISRWTPAR